MTLQVMRVAPMLRYRPDMSPSATPPVGTQLREWRQRRRLSQLDLSVDAEVSTRHLSCVETGRAMPSREMVLRLADRLDVPLRERNRLLTAAGFAPMYAERALDDPALSAARAAVEQILEAHEPFPALAVDRHWNLIAHNAASGALLTMGVAPELLAPPANVLRVSLHPDGLAPRILNLAQWRAHLFERLHHQIAVTADATLAALADELAGYPVPAHDGAAAFTPHASIVVPLVLDTPLGILSLISTMTVFGTPVEITLSELALETFFPADAATAEALRAAAAARR
jgi:transcriptional regulator with XRE-family HTH domain